MLESRYLYWEVTPSSRQIFVSGRRYIFQCHDPASRNGFAFRLTLGVQTHSNLLHTRGVSRIQLFWICYQHWLETSRLWGDRVHHVIANPLTSPETPSNRFPSTVDFYPEVGALLDVRTQAGEILRGNISTFGFLLSSKVFPGLLGNNR